MWIFTKEALAMMISYCKNHMIFEIKCHMHYTHNLIQVRHIVSVGIILPVFSLHLPFVHTNVYAETKICVYILFVFGFCCRHRRLLGVKDINYCGFHILYIAVPLSDYKPVMNYHFIRLFVLFFLLSEKLNSIICRRDRSYEIWIQFSFFT